MTPKDIKVTFGIDILEKNRSLPFVYLKNIYVNQQYAKKITITDIAISLGIGHATVLSLRKRNREFESREGFVLVKKAYEEQDKNIFTDAVLIIQKRRASVRESERIRRKTEMPKKRWSSAKIIEILRKYPTNRLWNVPMNEFTKEDYKTMETLTGNNGAE